MVMTYMIMEEVEHINSKSLIDKYPTEIHSIILDDKYKKLDKSYAAKVKKLHIIHCSKKLRSYTIKYCIRIYITV